MNKKGYDYGKEVKFLRLHYMNVYKSLIVFLAAGQKLWLSCY